MTDKTIKGLHSQTLIVAIKAVLSLVYFAIMSRLLTPDDFGYFALITAVTTILNSLSEAGLGSSVIQKKDASKDFASTAFTLSLILGLFFSVILFVFSNLFSQLVCGTNTLSLAFKIMSLMFLVFFNNYSAALSYYLFISLLITIIQTYSFRFVIKEESVRKMMAKNASKPRKKSKWQARLEEMQRQQQQMLREQQKQQRRR